jgi:hypothetical protein
MPGDTGVDAPVAWPSLLEARVRVRVRKMQAKLHRWALADSGFRLDDAFNFICDPPVLVTAFERVAGQYRGPDGWRGRRACRRRHRLRGPGAPGRDPAWR